MPIPEPHARFLANAVARLALDPRLVGVAVGGSYVSGAMDDFSDLDLVVAVDPPAMPEVLAARTAIAQSLGTLLVSFTGEHVGEPRLLICLYDAPLLHVDLKFVALPDVAARVEDPTVLWERDGRMTSALATGTAAYPEPDAQWIEDRFWTWVHYVAAKVGRGELFEALDSLAYLRARVLGPLGLRRVGARPSGVRKLERVAPELARALEATVATHDASSCLAALDATVAIYRDLRASAPPSHVHHAAEQAAMAYVAEVATHQRQT